MEEAFEDSSPPAINKIRNWNQGSARNYYPRPTPPDLQYEERGSFTTSHFRGRFYLPIEYRRKSEHEILSTLQEITMAVSAYKTKRYYGSQAATALAIGFDG